MTMKTLKKLVSIFSIAALGGFAALTANHFYFQKQANWMAEANIRNPLPVKFVGLNAPMPENNGDFVTAAQKSVPTVVNIHSKVEMQDAGYNSLYNYFYGSPRQYEGMVSGSGVIV